MKKSIVITILSLLLANISAIARGSSESNDSTARMRTLAYVDSLLKYREFIDSVYQNNDSVAQAHRLDARFYRLFAPLAYDSKVTDSQLSGAADSLAGESYDKLVEMALYNMYMNRPELVRTTVAKLHTEAAKAGEQTNAPVKRKVEIQRRQEVEEEVPVQGSVELFVKKPNFWKFKGDYSLQFMQNHVSENWYQNGESNLSALAAVTLQLNYDNKKKLKIDNKLEMKLGFQTSASDTIHEFKTTSDLLRYTGKIGIQATKRWYYTFQSIATTQFAYGLKSNDRKIYSDFLSPLVVNLSLGMDYNIETNNKKLTGSVHLAPFAYNWKYVGRANGEGNISKRNGIEPGHHSLCDYGSQFTVNMTWKPSENFRWQTRLYGFTTYKRTELEWENTLTFALSRYVSTTLFLYPRFDDGSNRGTDKGFWQFKEYISLGFNYNM